MEKPNALKREKTTDFLNELFPTRPILMDQDKNREFTRKLLKDNRLRVLEEIDEETTLYRAGNKIFLYQKAYKETIYYVIFQITSYRKNLGRMLQTTFLWRRPWFSQTDFLAGKVFFKYLLKETGVCISHSVQTNHAIRYWDALTGEALRSDRNAYYIDFNINHFDRITGLNDFERISNEKQPWGPEEKHKARRFIISERELKFQ